MAGCRIPLITQPLTMLLERPPRQCYNPSNIQQEGERAMATTTVDSVTTAAPLQRRRPWGRSILLGIWIVFVLLVLGVALFATYMVQHPLPTIHGTASLPVLSAPVTVVRDQSGIPHIT